MYNDSIPVEENNDLNSMNPNSEIVKVRSYFKNGKLLHQINSQDCGSPFADDYLLIEQKRINAEFKKLFGESRKILKANK